MDSKVHDRESDEVNMVSYSYTYKIAPLNESSSLNKSLAFTNALHSYYYSNSKNALKVRMINILTGEGYL